MPQLIEKLRPLAAEAFEEAHQKAAGSWVTLVAE